MKRALLIAMAITLVATLSSFAGDQKEEKKIKEHKETKQCTADPDVCKQKIAEKMTQMGMIGVDGDWDADKGVFIIKEFFEESNGESAGLAVGDELVKINGVAMADEKAYKTDAENRVPGKVVPVTFMRDGDELTVKVKLIATPKAVIKKQIQHHMQMYHSDDCEKEKMMKKKQMMEEEKQKKMEEK